MSALAQYFLAEGDAVYGYDLTPSPITDMLTHKGAHIHFDDNPEHIPGDIDFVVFTPAVPKTNLEFQYFVEKGIPMYKRSQVLGHITEEMPSIAVAGTHGKTTTTSMVSHLLAPQVPIVSFIGGIAKNFDDNLVLCEQPTLAVAEADEFDRSFLQLHPDMALITAMDADHLDIYGDLEHVQEAFRAFASQVSGTLIIKKGLPVTSRDTRARLRTYHFRDTEADFHATNLRQDGRGHFIYDLVHPEGVIPDIMVGTIGWVNVENSIAAAAICLTYGIAPEQIRHATGTFQGAKRRLDVHFNTEENTYIDDYAHHPEELSTAISSIREAFPERKLTVIFQPHLYTRTRDFADGFAESLSAADSLYLLDIYPAREEPIPGVTSEMILEKVTAPEKKLVTKDELLECLKADKPSLLVTFGAGDIDRLVEPIKAVFEGK